MRTVSFSQPQVQQSLSRDFVCFTTSTEGDPTAGQSIRHRPQDPAGPCIRGNGQQNVQTLFLTPEGEIFHAASGYLSPEDLLAELQFAQELFSKLKETHPTDRADLVRTSHRERLEKIGFTAEQIDAEGNLLGAGMNMQLLLPGSNPISAFLPGATPAGQDAGKPTVDPIAAFTRGQILTDQKFCIDRPLMSAVKFEKDPTPLVGNGKSFFMSSSGGNGG